MLNYSLRVTNQMNVLSKDTVKKVFEQETKLITIEDDVDKAHENIKKAGAEIKDADYYNKQTGSSVDKIFYIVAIVVGVLIFLAILMPNN